MEHVELCCSDIRDDEEVQRGGRRDGREEVRRSAGLARQSICWASTSVDLLG